MLKGNETKECLKLSFGKKKRQLFNFVKLKIKCLLEMSSIKNLPHKKETITLHNSRQSSFSKCILVTATITLQTFRDNFS